MPERNSYLPPAGVEWLLPVYDPWLRLLGGDRMREALLSQMAPAPGHRVLDVGCGTGSLVVLVEERHAGVVAVGLDPDRRALALAQQKAKRAGVRIQFNRGFSDQLPYRDASFDRVCCTFMFSLLSPTQQEATLREVNRVLRDGGSFHLLDLVDTRSRRSALVRVLLPPRRFRFHTADETLAELRQAGFADAAVTRQRNLWLWPFATYRAAR